VPAFADTPTPSPPVLQPPAILVIRLDSPVSPADISRLRNHVVAQLTCANVRAVSCDVGSVSQPDVTTIDALARLQLAIRQHGGALILRNASRPLLELLSLVGLADVLPSGLPSALEPSRQIEYREQAGVDEVVQPSDTAGRNLHELNRERLVSATLIVGPVLGDRR
jgi:ABC-type transporter Mla MlaB component